MPLAAESALDELDVPVTELAVDELVELERGVSEVVGLEARRERVIDPRQAREDPAIFDRGRLWFCLGVGVDRKQDETCGVKELVRELLPLLDLLDAVADVLAR